MRARPIGILAALELEATSLGPLRDSVRLHVCGIGGAAAEQAARRLIRDGISGLLSWGSATGLVDGLGSGNIVLPDTLCCSDGARLSVDASWRARLASRLEGALAVSGGTLAEARGMLCTPAEKRRLHEATDAVAADMESCAIARAAAEAGLPFVALRVILDTAGLAVPGSALRGLGADGRARPAALAGALLGRPAELLPVLRLARAYALARRTLAAAARLAGETLTGSVAPAR